MIGGIVLAAGAGTRFGTSKQLAYLDGRPLLEHAIRAMTASPVDRVVVVLGAGADEVMAGVDPHGAEFPYAGAGTRASRPRSPAGWPSSTDCEAAVITLGDQPRLSPGRVARVIAARAEGVDAIRATYGGEPGHPVLLEHRMFERMRDVTGDHGARNLLLSVPTREVPCDDLGGGEDVDTSGWPLDQALAGTRSADPAAQLRQVAGVDRVRHRRLAVGHVGAGGREPVARVAPEVDGDDRVVDAVADRHRQAARRRPARSPRPGG